MSSWLGPFTFGFPLGAGLALTPLLLQRRLNRRTRRRLAASGLRPGLRLRVMLSPSSAPGWADLTIYVSNRTKDVWQLQRIGFQPAAIKGVLKDDRLLARSCEGLSALPGHEIDSRGSVLPSKWIYPDDATGLQFTGLAEGTYEHLHIRYPTDVDHVVVNIILRRNDGRIVTLKAVRSLSRL